MQLRQVQNLVLEPLQALLDDPRGLGCINKMYTAFGTTSAEFYESFQARGPLLPRAAARVSGRAIATRHRHVTSPRAIATRHRHAPSPRTIATRHSPLATSCSPLATHTCRQPVLPTSVRTMCSCRN